MMAGRPKPTAQNPTGQFRTSGAEDLVLKAFATSPVWPTASAGIFARIYCSVVDQPQVKDFGLLVVADLAWWREIKPAHPPLAPNMGVCKITGEGNWEKIGMPEETADLMEEWKSLRDESARKQEFVGRLILVTVAGDLAIFSFAATRQIPTPVDAFIALLSVALTTLSYFWILRNFYSGMRIAQYIKDYIEPKTGLHWENWRNQSRRRGQPQAKPKIQADIFSTFYHSLLSLSLIVSIILIWAPQSHYVGNGTSLPLHVSVATSVALTAGFVLFVVVWYVLANITFVSRIRSEIRQLIFEMLGTSESADEQRRAT